MDKAVIEGTNADYSASVIDVLEQDILDVSPFLLDLLLQDKTTGQNIVWACDDYIGYGSVYTPEKEILPALITGVNTKIIQPRIAKNKEAQRNRTRKSAEVFTPSWICRLMNDLCDEEWFGRKNVFNIPTDDDCDWTPTASPVEFEQGKGKTPAWTRYVDSKRLEITCGEAPYLVSRYDTTTGEFLPIEKRIGVLDRKLRIIGENTQSETDWFFWARRAFESTYGYEYQGDNLLLARENLLFTFTDYYTAKFQKSAPLTLLKQIANIIAWNVWQMDGLKDCVPFRAEQSPQLDLFADIPTCVEQTDCIIKDWRSKKILKFKELKGIKTMKFDFVIGNPPYQDESNVREELDKDNKRNFAPPIYHLFLDESYKISTVVEMIHPARFLFNAGSTPKAWNEKMLNDEHLKVLYYEPDSNKVFPSLSTPIKGGVTITYRNSKKDFGAIKTFTQFRELNALMRKVISNKNFKSICNIVYSRTSYRLTELMHKENSWAIERLSEGHAFDMSSNIFNLLHEIFFDNEPKDGKNYIRILGRESNKRIYKYIRKDFVNDVDNLNFFKVLIPQATGSGNFGEAFTFPFVEKPLTGSTETFISIGKFTKDTEALACKKYICSKFARALLGVLKVTQNGNKPVWKYVPLQDFTDNSDIDWSKSVHEIDLQLYKKYGLSDEEIAFIETHVKEMA